MIKVCEIFETIQGEGLLQGIPSIIVRFPGCNLKCVWCDNSTASETKLLEYSNILDLVDAIDGYNSNYIVITGGEPLIQPDIVQLTSILSQRGYHITIETNGTIQKNIVCDLVSISPKLKNSIPELGSFKANDDYSNLLINYESLSFYTKSYTYQLKFVIRDEDDIKEIEGILANIEDLDKERVLLMPLAENLSELNSRQKEIVYMCIKYGYRYANRLQLQVWQDDVTERMEMNN